MCLSWLGLLNWLIWLIRFSPVIDTGLDQLELFGCTFFILFIILSWVCLVRLLSELEMI